MKGRLQSLFERLVAVAQEENRQRALAHRLFAAPVSLDPLLESPACWRRSLRIQQPARRTRQ